MPGLYSPDPLTPDSDPTRDFVRQRVLETAGRLFAVHGIRAVSLEQITLEAQVSRGALARLYESKDGLVVDYLTVWHRFEVRSFQAAVDGHRAREAFGRIVDDLVEHVKGRSFCGFPFVVAAIEFTDHRHVIRGTVTAHREWYTQAITDLLRAAGHPLPGDAADDFVLAHDGVVTGAFAGDPVSSVAALRRAVERILELLTP